MENFIEDLIENEEPDIPTIEGCLDDWQEQTENEERNEEMVRDGERVAECLGLAVDKWNDLKNGIMYALNKYF